MPQTPPSASFGAFTSGELSDVSTYMTQILASAGDTGWTTSTDVNNVANSTDTPSGWYRGLLRLLIDIIKILNNG